MQKRDTNVILITIVETIFQHFPAQITPVWNSRQESCSFTFERLYCPNTMPRIIKKCWTISNIMLKLHTLIVRHLEAILSLCLSLLQNMRSPSTEIVRFVPFNFLILAKSSEPYQENLKRTHFQHSHTNLSKIQNHGLPGHATIYIWKATTCLANSQYGQHVYNHIPDYSKDPTLIVHHPDPFLNSRSRT